VARNYIRAQVSPVGADTNPRLVGPGKRRFLDRKGLHWFPGLDVWVDFKRKKVFRYKFVLAATFVSLFTDVAAENRVPGVWEIYGSPLVPSELKTILPIAILRRQEKRGRQGHAPT